MRRPNATLSLAALLTLVASSARPSPQAAAAPAPQAKGRAPAHAAEAKPDAVPRAGIEALEAQLDRALDRVSLPQLAGLLGRTDSARGYRLPGYGVVVVLTPRALPGEDGALRVFLRPRGHVRVERRLRPGEAPVAVEPDPQEIEALERQVVILQHETERTRREAEQDMERIVHEVRIRRTPDAEPAAAPEPAEAPEPPEPPVAPPAPGTPSAPAPPSAAPAAPLPPPAPPWKYWFETQGPRDDRTPERVVADVRAALLDALAGPAGRIPGLPPEESVAVAVDFEPGGVFVARARPARTLVVRARVRDLEARASGAIPVEELRRRLEVVEY